MVGQAQPGRQVYSNACSWGCTQRSSGSLVGWVGLQLGLVGLNVGPCCCTGNVVAVLVVGTVVNCESAAGMTITCLLACSTCDVQLYLTALIEAFHCEIEQNLFSLFCYFSQNRRERHTNNSPGLQD